MLWKHKFKYSPLGYSSTEPRLYGVDLSPRKNTYTPHILQLYESSVTLYLSICLSVCLSMVKLIYLSIYGKTS